MNRITKTLLGIALGSVAAVAQALPINGSFGLVGNFAPLGGATASTATGIDFMASVISVCGGSYTSIFGTCATVGGDAAVLGDIASGTLPAAGPVAYSDMAWITTATLSFDLTTITNVLRNGSGLTSLEIRGTGVANTTVAGFDPTPGTFILTLNGNGPGNFTFSNSVQTAAVPEPGSLALLGLGIIGLGLSRRRKAN